MDRRTLELLLRDDSAQGLVEYALILALVAMVAIAALRLLGSKVKNSLNKAAASLT
jgi:pilus assembly protein Flp/PilA